MKAAGLPSRADGSPIEPFVEASFIGEKAQTQVGTGIHPTWYETLRIDFVPIDFEEDTLCLIDDCVVLSFYDQVRIPLPNPRNVQGATIQVTHFRIENRFIGSIKLPFYTLHQAPKACVEGVFTVVTPRWIMGYNIPQEAPIASLYFSLWPPLVKKATPPTDDKMLLFQVSMLPVPPQLAQLHHLALAWRLGARIGTRSCEAAESARRPSLLRAVRVQRKGGLHAHLPIHTAPTVWRPPKSVASVPAAIRFVSLIPFGRGHACLERPQ